MREEFISRSEMRYIIESMVRRLRITVSVFFVSIFLSLCVLWGRSYWRVDYFGRVNPGTVCGVMSVRGELRFSVTKQQATGLIPKWFLLSQAYDSAIEQALEATDGCLLWDSKPSRTLVFVPHMIAALFFALLAISSWLLIRRFTIRSMLIVTMLVALFLALVVFQMGGL
jgi:hypothetical protein